MAYFGTTSPSSQANPPRQLVAPFATNPALAGTTEFLSTQGSTAANNPNGPGGGGGGVWYYSSTNLTTDLTGANFFMRAGDMVLGTQFTSLGSSVITFQGAINSVSTAGASLSTGSLITSTFN